MQGNGVKGELLTDEVEGPLTQQQEKTEEEKHEEAGGISSQSLLFLIVTCLVSSSLLPHAWQVLDLLQQMAKLLLPPGEPSHRVMVSSIRALQLRLR